MKYMIPYFDNKILSFVTLSHDVNINNLFFKCNTYSSN